MSTSLGEVKCVYCGGWVYPWTKFCPYCGKERPANGAEVDPGKLMLMKVIEATQICEACASEHDLPTGVTKFWSRCEICLKETVVRKVRD